METDKRSRPRHEKRQPDMPPFHIRTSPLTGSNLIEASAGTGKTYTIAGIYLRLLLESDIPWDQVLVVTFTRAATEELKDRIRRKLVETSLAAVSGRSEDALIQDILDRCRSRPDIRKRILETLVEFDRAPIFTIHGFCQRMLNENAFETGTLFDFELLSDPADLVREVAEDDWRENFTETDPEFICHCGLRGVTGPAFFVRLFQRLRSPETAVLPARETPPPASLAEFRQCLQRVAAAWPGARADVERLLRDPGLSGKTYGGPKYREEKVAALISAVDRYVENSRWLAYPIWDGMTLLSAGVVAGSARKGCMAPDHPFFHAWEALLEAEKSLAAEMDAALIQRKREFLQTAGEKFETWKKRKDALVFEDLLMRLRDALRSKKGDAGLASTLRKRFRVALLDEFQDTDNVQYEIFSRLFEKKGASLFMIGDPKQSIYGFRGADIFSYLKAARDAEARYTLSGNWRSSPGLIRAVNTLFSSRANPFVFDRIPFREEFPADGEKRSADPGDAAMVVWVLDGGDGDTPIQRGDAEARVVRAVADEIRRMTSLTGGGPARPPDDIAVLVRTNRQAKLIRQALALQGVPAVVQGAGNVFQTREAVELERVLAAVFEPADETRCRAALVTDMLGCRADDSAFSETGSDAMAARLARFHRYARSWAKDGFIRMLAGLMREEGVRTRLLQFPDGERRLTNVLQLSEILHRESLANRNGMSGLLSWMRGRMDSDAAAGEEYQLRLESDQAAVQVTTIHRSKGLEYEVVFCPFLWDRPDVDAGDILFHDPDRGHRMTLDLGSADIDRHRRLAAAETLAENLRILYVALTRAKARCCLAWGNIRDAERSALGYLLLDGGGPNAENGAEDRRPGGKEILAALDRLEARAGGSIAVRPIPDPAALTCASVRAEPESLSCREFTGRIDRRWRISSFSAMVSESREGDDARDHDVSAAELEAGKSALAPAHSRDTGNRTIFDFPRGARAGNFFHEIFECIDFTPGGGREREAVVSAALARYGYASYWAAPVMHMLDAVLSAPLPGTAEGLRLQAVADTQRINEMGFTFSLAEFDADGLADVFRKLPDGTRPATPNFIGNIGKLRLSPAGGYMKGFMDLVFEHGGRYFLVDWKSNHLGGDAADYGRKEMAAAMDAHYYPLQYHIYTLALHLMLKHRIPAYRYDRHFGGVWYIFIRGVSPEKGSDFGFFQDRPAAGTMEALERLMIPGKK